MEDIQSMTANVGGKRLWRTKCHNWSEERYLRCRGTSLCSPRKSLRFFFALLLLLIALVMLLEVVFVVVEFGVSWARIGHGKIPLARRPHLAEAQGRS